MLVTFMTRLSILAIKTVSSISIIIVFASSASFLISFVILCISIIVSNPFNVLWYNLDQSSRSLFITCAWSLLLSFLEIYGLGEVGAVAKVLLMMLLVGKDICKSALELEWFLGLVEMGFLPLFFIGFNSNILSNSLQPPVLHVVTPFLLSTDHVRPYILSSAPSIVFPVLISCASVLLLLHTLLPH